MLTNLKKIVKSTTAVTLIVFLSGCVKAGNFYTVGNGNSGGSGTKAKAAVALENGSVCLKTGAELLASLLEISGVTLITNAAANPNDVATVTTINSLLSQLPTDHKSGSINGNTVYSWAGLVAQMQVPWFRKDLPTNGPGNGVFSGINLTTLSTVNDASIALVLTALTVKAFGRNPSSAEISATNELKNNVLGSAALAQSAANVTKAQQFFAAMTIGVLSAPEFATCN